MEPIITIRNLSKTFGQGDGAVHALKDISLDVYPGEIFGIIGLSGAGKSTLVRCVNLLERPSAGTVVVDGREMTALRRRDLLLARRNVTMIFQSFNLLMQRNCLRNVCFPMELAGVPKDQARRRGLELLDLVGLSGKADAYPVQLSGGQKQRVAIARALATDPKVLLCDEATSALDPTTTASILALLKDLNRKLRVTMLVITHQMSVIEEVCSRVAILDEGEIVEQGTVEDIFNHPATDAARRLVYPGGVERLPSGTRTIRVAFNGGTAYQPLIASLALDCGVKANILGADTRNIDGKAFGTMLLGLPEDVNEAAKAVSYLRAQPHVTVEEAVLPADGGRDEAARNRDLPTVGGTDEAARNRDLPTVGGTDEAARNRDLPTADGTDEAARNRDLPAVGRDGAAGDGGGAAGAYRPAGAEKEAAHV